MVLWINCRISLPKMSSKILDNSSAVYAVVDKKRKVLQDQQDCSEDSANFAVYSVVEAPNFTDDENVKDNDQSDVEVNHNGNSDGNIASIYSVVERKNLSKSAHINNIPSFHVGKKGTKKSSNTFQILFTLIILGCLVLFITALVAAVARCYSEISDLKTEITQIESRYPINTSKQMSNQHLSILQSQLDDVKKNISITFFQLLENNEVIGRLNSKIAHVRNKSDINLNSFIMLNSTIRELFTKFTGIMTSNMKLNTAVSTLTSSYSSLEISINMTDSKLEDDLRKQRSKYYKLNNLTNTIINTIPSASSCKGIFMHHSLPSGYYWLRLSNGSTVQVYCDMTMSCDNITGGWMRVAKLKKNDGVAECFQNFTNYRSNNSQCIIRSNKKKVCSQVFFPDLKIEYSHVCGTIQGYGLRTPDGFRDQSIDNNYVDGISLTYGRRSRQHIWTFAARVDRTHTSENAPCNYNSPMFLQENFSCMKLVNNRKCPLGDCSPKFSRNLGTLTTEDIEMRVCRNQLSSDEDILLDNVEIYVQ